MSGDLRFVSHRDCLRAVEMVATRAQLPLKYSQGFNPRPVLSLPVPRPVGVASCDDRLVLNLTEDLSARDLLTGLNRCAPRGMTFDDATALGVKATPQPQRAHYRLDLSTETATTVVDRLTALQAQPSWPRERAATARPSRRGTVKKPRTIDLKELIEAIDLQDNTLTFTLCPRGDRWARPAEVLALLGLDPRVDIANLTRLTVEYHTKDTGRKPGASSDPAPADTQF